MAKSAKKPSEKRAAKSPPLGAMKVRNPETGRSVTVKGVGALKGNALKLKKGLNLTKPIAEQALKQDSGKRRIVARRSEQRRAG